MGTRSAGCMNDSGQPVHPLAESSANLNRPSPRSGFNDRTACQYILDQFHTIFQPNILYCPHSLNLPLLNPQKKALFIKLAVFSIAADSKLEI